MAKQNTPREPASPRQSFTFYAADGRVYASNADQKLVDLGSLVDEGQGWHYLLDGNQQAGEGFSTPEAALRHIADHTRFLYLDGQFTALADLREGDAPVHLDGAARIDVMMDELQRGEPMEDASV
jgi:hypothetical protein